jgi:hypothetical protein
MARAAGWMAAVALGALVGFVCRGWLEATSGPGLPPPPALSEAATGNSARADADGPLRRELERLRAELATEVALREELRGELEELRGKLAATAEPGSKAGNTGSRVDTADLKWLDEALLLEAGLRTADIDVLRERFEEIEMERLYLRDEATREGWLSTHRYRRAARELDTSFGALRDEFGDEAYDWLLYASGRANRVLVGGVLESSPAAQAGLESGDLVFSYDGVRIFSAGELQVATSEGEAGQPVVLALDRGAERVRVYTARGPLGVRLGRRRVKPTGRR